MKKELTTDEKRKWIYNDVHDSYFTPTRDWHPELRGKRGKYYRPPVSFEGISLIDSNFYDNDNLTQQFYVQPVNVNSKVGSAIADVAAETETQKKIEKAEGETFGRLALYAHDDVKDLWVLNFLFFNRSFARSMENFRIIVEVETSPDKTYLEYNNVISSQPITSSEKNKFYNTVAVSVDKHDLLSIAQKKAKFSVFFDDVVVEFEKKFSLKDLLAVDFLNDSENWTDEAIEKYYPVFLGDKVKKDVKAVDFTDKEVLKKFVKDPLSVPELAELNNYCEMTGKKSSLLAKLDSSLKNRNKEVIDAELKELDERVEKGPGVIKRGFLWIGIGILAMSMIYGTMCELFSDYWGFSDFYLVLLFSLPNWGIGFLIAFIERGSKEEDKLYGVITLLAIFHLVFGIWCIAEESFGFHLWSSWIVLAGCFIYGANLGQKFNPRNFGQETQLLVTNITEAVEKF